MKKKLEEKFKIFLEDHHILSNGEVNRDISSEEMIEVINGFVEEREVNFEDIHRMLDEMNLVLDSTPCTVSIIDENLKYISVNNTLAEICGLKKEEFYGKEVGFYTDNRCFYNFSKLLFRSKEYKISEELETQIGDEARKFWVVGSKLDNNHRILIIGVDITEFKMLEDHITFMDKLSSLGEMVASIIHEVNNPLSMIDMKSQNIMKRLEKNHELDENSLVETNIKVSQDIQSILRTTEKISKIIRGVKSFVRHGNNDEKVKTNLSEVISDAMSICIGKAKMDNISLEYINEGEEIFVKCNITQMFQIFVNLMTNACDAIADNEEKWIKIQQSETNDGHLQIDIIDSGRGIPKKVVNKIFDSFFTTKELGKGTGLGLSLCKKIMEEHEGDLFVDNSRPNTTFCVKLKKS